jgi:hypothetical protein
MCYNLEGEASFTPCRATAAVRPVDLHAVENLHWKQKDSEENGGRDFLNFNSELLLKWQLNIKDPSKTKIQLFVQFTVHSHRTRI